MSKKQRLNLNKPSLREMRKFAKNLPTREEVQTQIVENRKTLLALAFVFVAGLVVGAVIAKNGDKD